jgi:UDP-N-acetylmuramoyl-L-alanyl-D-glutamate--2,6-diaminopimelate ligase
MQRLSAVLSLFSLRIDDLCPDCSLTGVCDDSRQVEPGDLFVAYPGEQTDGRSYIGQAIARGAVACLVEAGSDLAFSTDSVTVPLFFVSDLRSHLAEIARLFYPLAKPLPHFLGVTGTNGKTSCVQFFAQILNACQQRVAVLGTVGNGIWPQLEPSSMTTLGALGLQRRLHNYVLQSVNGIAMEVSSHALEQHRVEAVDFDVALFTGLSRDHLDYHYTMNAYGEAKARLFQSPYLRYAVVNVDDSFTERLMQLGSLKCQWFGVSLRPDACASIPLTFPRSIKQQSHGFMVDLSTPWGESSFFLPLLGTFNVMNVMMVITACCTLGYDLASVCSAVSSLLPVSGRMQMLQRQNQPRVVVDYAHTPDALEKSLLALRAHCSGKLWCVFGCGGERDRGKRPLMATVAEHYADQVIVTSDNSRGEMTQRIIDDIRLGFVSEASVLIKPIRRKAIAQAIEGAGVNDVILLAGRGHESQQVVGKEVIPGTDEEWVGRIFDSIEHRGAVI